MSLVNISITEGHKVLISWIVVQIEPNLTFISLFQLIRASRHPRITVSVEMLRTELEQVLVGSSKNSLSKVDENLVDEVCVIFSQHIKILVRIHEDVEESTSTTATLRNALLS